MHQANISTLLQVPLTQYRAEPQSPAAAMLYTGEDRTVSAALANNLFVQNTLTSAAVAAPIANFQSQAAQVTRTLQCNWSKHYAASPLAAVIREAVYCIQADCDNTPDVTCGSSTPAVNHWLPCNDICAGSPPTPFPLRVSHVFDTTCCLAY